MNVLDFEKRNLIMQLLVEGNSLRSIERIVGCSINTVSKFFVDAGRMAYQYQYETLKQLKCHYIQVDELWSFCYAKSKAVKRMNTPPVNAGSVWTWVAMCSESKLAISWHIGQRTTIDAHHFATDLRKRVGSEIQITSDGFNAYIEAIQDAFKYDVHYAMLVKQYDKKQRYIGAEKRIIIGTPNFSKVTTSHIERQNLTLRTNIKRYTRKTNGFFTKFERHCLATSLHYLYYNFVRIHQTLNTTPAVAAGVTTKEWKLSDITTMVRRQAPETRGSYNKVAA